MRMLMIVSGPVLVSRVGKGTKWDLARIFAEFNSNAVRSGAWLNPCAEP